ncbi:hypothetical protein [Campylobacter concisus]|nr:hypothetical protein [Campylobacter concisus]
MGKPEALKENLSEFV